MPERQLKGIGPMIVVSNCVICASPIHHLSGLWVASCRNSLSGEPFILNGLDYLHIGDSTRSPYAKL